MGNKKKTLIVNTKHTAIRITTMPEVKSSKVGIVHKLGLLQKKNQHHVHKHVLKPNDEQLWTIIKDVFPYGETLNAQTHVFDSSLFENEQGEHRLFFAALPMAVSDELAEQGIKKHKHLSNIVSLDTLEHVLFREYCVQCDVLTLIVFEQSEGWRVLVIDQHLPVAAPRFINTPEHRENLLSFIIDDYCKNAVNETDAANADERMQFIILHTAESKNAPSHEWLTHYLTDRHIVFTCKELTHDVL